MDEAEERVLRDDYALLAERARYAEVEKTDARWGLALQIRPKAANARIRTRSHDLDGVPVRVMPRAFYLRAGFTRALLLRALPELG
jgi:DNA mismatch repair protein MutH